MSISRNRLHLLSICVFLQELQALITYIQMNKDSDTDWFTIQPEDGGKAWKGKCWCAAHCMLVHLTVAPPAPLQQPGSTAPG
jgi:ufm1-conjugating enzyme 1